MVPKSMKGGYLSRPTESNGRTYNGRVDVPLENIASVRDLLMTLRHEVLGHYGANTFAPAEKRAFLDGITAAREEPSMAGMWADIDRRYAGSSKDTLAEEVFALACEWVAPSQHVGNDQVQARGQQSFAETCIARVRPMQDSDLQNIAYMVAQGIHDRSRRQQTFPQINELFRKGETMEPKKPFHEVVAEKLIEQLKAGTAPWQKPWAAGEFGSMPMNPTTGNRYKGINSLQLMMQGHSDPRWMTYNQANALDAQVRKGEKSTMIQYWKFSEERIKKEDGKPVLDAKGNKVKETVLLERPKCFHAYVFNAEQIDGLPAITRKEQTWDAVERAEHILQASGARITHAAGDRAFYRSSTDSITMPERSQFPSADNYYATALHELGHWTGHPSRLDRDLSHPFGSEGYAKEELRAEISSMILGNELGIGHDPGQHVAYVGSWIKALQEDPLEIFRAAADAEKIQAFVLAFEQKQVQDHQVDVEQLDSEQAEVLTHIQEAHKSANLGYSSLESWQTLERAAEANGLKAVLRWSNAGEDEADIRIEYLDADGKFIPVHTELHSGDGKAVSCIEGRRVSGTGMTSDAEWQTEALNSAIATVRHQQENTPAVRYQEMLSEGGRLVDRLVASKLMTQDDAALTDARRDLLSMSVSPDADREAFRKAGEKALGFELPPEWDGSVELSAMRDGDGLSSQYVVRVGADDQARQVAVLNTPAEAIALADRLLTIEAYSQHAASKPQELKSVQEKLENHQSDARFQLYGTQQQEATLEQGQQLPKPEITPQQLTAEKWVLDNLNSNLHPAIARMNESQLDIVQGVLDSMHPMGNNNEFWQRHEAAAEAMFNDPDGVEKKIFDAKDGVQERLETIQSNPLSAMDLDVVKALQVYRNYQASAEHDAAAVQLEESLAPKLEAAFGQEVPLPRNWTGAIQVRGAVEEGDGTDIVEAASVDRAPEFFSLYAQDADGLQLCVADCETEELAEEMAGRLRLIDAYGQLDTNEQAAKLARIREEQVRQDPNSTAEDISAAKEDRKSAEVALALNDPEIQKLVAEIEKAELLSKQGKSALSPSNVAKEKTWLVVPYEQRDEAKQVAGKLQNGRPAIGFDKPTKCWYAQPGADLEKLKKWLPENQVRQAPAMAPREEFALAMKELGLSVEGEHPIQDGKMHRVPVEGGSKGNTSGAYKLHEVKPGEKGIPAGFIENHRTGVKTTWAAKGYSLSEGDKAAFQAEAARRKVQSEQERQSANLRSMKAVGELLAIAPQAPADHTYLKNKECRPCDLKVVPTDGVGLPSDSIILIGKTAKESKALREANPQNLVFTAGDLLLTAQDANGDLKAVQSIRSNGSKMFAKGTEKHQNFHIVGGDGLEALKAAPVIVLGEGYATADTLSQSLGFATVAAFDSGNLGPVAKQLREQFPDKPFVIAGDNDLHQELIDGKNVGRTKAQEAAKAVDGKAIFPIFAPGEQAYPAGLEPIDPDKHRVGQSSPEQVKAIDHMKGFTDFNDLATKSSLGREGLDRQVRSEIGLAIEKHQARIEQPRQERTQTKEESHNQQSRRAMSH